MHICIQTGDKDKNKPAWHLGDFIPSIASAMYVPEQTLTTIHLHFYFLLRRSNVLSKIIFIIFYKPLSVQAKLKKWT